jgi:hypothetical protein
VVQRTSDAVLLAHLKKVLFEPFMEKSDHFTKTGSGKTSEKLQKGPFCFNYNCPEPVLAK